MHRRLIGIGLGLLLSAAAWLAWSRGIQPVRIPPPADLDMVHMLQAIAGANDGIGAANTEILAALGDVHADAAGVERVYQRLQTLESLLAEQHHTLDKLRLLTADQASLSSELNLLTAGIRPDTKGLAATAAVEAGLVDNMQEATAELALSLRELHALNRDLAAKLNRAEALSADILTQLP